MFDQRIQHCVIVQTAGGLSMHEIQHEFQSILSARELRFE
jgi:hypothetical protein